MHSKLAFAFCARERTRDCLTFKGQNWPWFFVLCKTQFEYTQSDHHHLRWHHQQQLPQSARLELPRPDHQDQREGEIVDLRDVPDCWSQERPLTLKEIQEKRPLPVSISRKKKNQAKEEEEKWFQDLLHVHFMILFSFVVVVVATTTMCTHTRVQFKGMSLAIWLGTCYYKHVCT